MLTEMRFGHENEAKILVCLKRFITDLPPSQIYNVLCSWGSLVIGLSILHTHTWLEHFTYTHTRTIEHFTNTDIPRPFDKLGTGTMVKSRNG